MGDKILPTGAGIGAPIANGLPLIVEDEDPSSAATNTESSLTTDPDSQQGYLPETEETHAKSLREEIFAFRKAIGDLLDGKARGEVLSKLPLWSRGCIPTINTIDTGFLSSYRDKLIEYFPFLLNDTQDEVQKENPKGKEKRPDSVVAFFNHGEQEDAIRNLLLLFRNISEIDLESVSFFLGNSLFEESFLRWLRARFDYEYEMEHPPRIKDGKWIDGRDEYTKGKLSQYRAKRQRLTTLYFKQALFEDNDYETELGRRTKEEIARLEEEGIVPLLLTQYLEGFYTQYASFLELIREANLSGNSLHNNLKHSLTREQKNWKDQWQAFRRLLNEAESFFSKFHYIEQGRQLDSARNYVLASLKDPNAKKMQCLVRTP